MFVSGPMEMAVDMESHLFGMQANVAFDSPRSTAPLDAIIVGGGPAGLAAAKYLADAGRSALVLEKRPILGGKLSSWRDRDGDVLETGLHSFFGGYDTVHALLRDVGIAHHVRWQPHTLTFAMPPGFSQRVGTEAVFEAFHFVDAPSPFNGIGAVLNARYIFNAWEKVLFAAGTLPILVGDHAYAERQDDITYAQWHRQRGMSDHMLQTFFAPMALALNFTPVEAISAEAMLRVMAYFASSRDASRAGFLDGPPNERLIEPIAQHVQTQGVRIERTARVAALLFSGDVCSGVRTDDGRTYEADNVILATPVHDAAKLLPPAMLRDPLVHGVGKLTSSPVINGHFWFDRPISPHTNLIFGAGTLLPVHADLGQASPGYAWPGKSFLEVCIAPADDLMLLDDEAVIERVLADMTKLYPLATKDSLVKAKLVRVPKSVYRASPGAERLRPGSRTPVANLFLAGCYTNHRFPASIEGAMRSARAAADAVLARTHARR
jgi:15-cis-phytoene desaturase